MPGIIGIISESSEHVLFQRMIDAVNHYDYSIDHFARNGICLGRVHLNCVNTEPQPVFSEDRRYALMMIGEIFSYGNIETADIQSDSSFLLNILIQDGLKALPAINGHYSAVLYDFTEKKLVLISDRYGTRPVYYAQNQSRFLFAPEVKAILEDTLNNDIDYSAVSELFHFCHLFGHRTLFSGIHQLPEASYLILQNNMVQVVRYWDFPYFEDTYVNKKTGKKKEEQYVSALEDKISTAMSRVFTKNSDEIILSLSGGLDSRYVAAYAKELTAGNLSAFTFGPDNSEDQIYAAKVAELLEIQHSRYEVKPEKIWKDAMFFAYIADYMSMIYGPIHGFTPVQDNFRKKSVTISSQMADAIFGGNLWRRKIQYLIQSGSFNNKTRGIIINMFNLMDEGLLKELFADDFYVKIKDGYMDVPVQYIERYQHPLFTYINLLMNEHGRRGTFSGNLMNNLFMETRMPSYDYDLMDLAYELPLPLRFHQHAYRKVFSNRFPELAGIRRERYNLRIDSPDIVYELKILENKIINTLKKTFLRPVIMQVERWGRPVYIDHNRWFKKELNKEMTALLTDKRTLSRGVFKKNGIEKIIEGHMKNLTDHSKLIWQIINLELFFRKYFDSGH